jgi:tripartite-type tricarboxylate transporter receptor subunit TctC
MISISARHRLLAAAVVLVGAASAWSGTWAQTPAPTFTRTWPTKPIRVIVPLTPGSATDVMARVVMDQVSAQVAQPIIVENRPGAGNTIGMGAVAKAEPDGYTILANSSTHTVTPATRTNLGFEMTDLAAIAPLGNMPVVLVVNPSKGYKTLGDFVAAAKARPGSVNYASAGAGNSSHLNGERFRRAAGFEAVHLPFKGAPEALTEVVAGRADFYFAPLINALPLLKDGQLQALAVSGSLRASALPDVPTTVEAGYPNSEYNFWAGVFAPSKVPADIRAKLHDEIAKALQQPAVREKLLTLGADPMPLTSAQFETLVRNEIETNGQLVKAAGIKVN